MSGDSLSIPGVLYVGASGEKELAVLHAGPAVGWVALKGIEAWSREISVVFKAQLPPAVRRELGVTLPEEDPAVAQLPNALRAAQASELVAVDASRVDAMVSQGVRVHTVGSDRITGGFYYFAKGGAGGAVRAQSNLVEMIAPALAVASDNAAIEAHLDGLVSRVLSALSGGELSEEQIELAAELPALGEPAAEAAAKLQTLEGFLVLAGRRAAKYEERARAVVEMVGKVTSPGEDRVRVPLFGDARRVVQPPLEIEYAEGESGDARRLTLPARSRWLVAGLLSETMPPPAVAPKAEDASLAADKAAAAKAAAAKAAAEKAAAEKAASERAAAEKAAAAKAAAEKAAAEKAAAAKAAAEKAAAEKAAAEKAAAEKAAAEKEAAEKEAPEKEAPEKAAAKKPAADKAAAKKPAAAEKAATATSGKGASKQAATKKRSSTDGARAQPQALARTKPGEGSSAAMRQSQPMPLWVWVVLALAAAAGAYYFAFVRHHG